MVFPHSLQTLFDGSWKTRVQAAGLGQAAAEKGTPSRHETNWRVVTARNPIRDRLVTSFDLDEKKVDRAWLF